MSFQRASSPNQGEIRPLAQGWGKIVVRRAFGDEGPGLDLDFDTFGAGRRRCRPSDDPRNHRAGVATTVASTRGRPTVSHL